MFAVCIYALQAIGSDSNHVWNSAVHENITEFAGYLKVIDDGHIDGMIAMLPSWFVLIVAARESAFSARSWLMLAALAVIDQKACAHLCEKFKETSVKIVFCDNHDDGETVASSQCALCEENYCSDCDRHIHYSRGKVL